ncbi:hypothetical protein D3C78_18270 [compost metagenome]
MKMKSLQLSLSVARGIERGINKLKRNQKGELPYWLNVVGVIAVIVVIVIIVYQFLPSAIQTAIQNQLNRLLNTIS